ncbi:pyridoxamine 5'-phosphate oxidase family protein [Cupriavidus pauculus]|uniref:2Fe-2S iron-sulfur cluster-binding protein n=1 Tax=Cupriavidus pauculus TaxID=82633 RepID=UPI001EE199CA|nr:pyridoxamine 5'-phosphate oxidase family protein [Cupriavidus pauculus]GJG97604.1 pyridoxamine 5'-phosphate oxidase family protein [Cupriavidus pauculus]
MATDTANEKASPWHAGELSMQRKLGVAERMADVGRRVIRDYMPDQHRQFFAGLPFLVLGAVDEAGDPWATVIAGRPGFTQSPASKSLHVAVVTDPRDPASAGLVDGAGVGLLGVEFQTRRRNRMNGVVTNRTGTGFDVTVAQSFGNCPQYLQLRDPDFARDPSEPSAAPAQKLAALGPRERALIGAADMLFVASYIDGEDGAPRQVDVSSRGGKSGFVRVGDDGMLTVPDFAGNLFFATLGNFLVNPRASVAFVDFETGDMLQLSGTASVSLDDPEIGAFQGAERLWHFMPRQIVFRPDALPLRWKFLENGWSPNSLMTGSWDQVAERLKAAALANAWRPFRVVDIVDESSTIRSFHLQPDDGAGLLPHVAGQHLPIRVSPPACGKPVIRTYTISVAPSDGIYRISVKREGLVSAHLHDTLQVGSVIEARAPAGQFVVDAAERRPAVLLAAGVGITPLLAMLRHVVYEGLRKRRVRGTWMFQSARSLGERAFTEEIRRLADAGEGKVHVVRVLSEVCDAVEGQDYDFAGRIDMALLRRTLPFDDFDFYLCGPPGFMQATYDGLRDLNIADARIHAEAFGPAGLTRRQEAATAAAVGPIRTAAQVPTPVAFVRSGKEARWSPGDGTLLELAEARGLSPEFSCRGGTCGTCRTKIVEGAVAYATAPAFSTPDDEALICCAVPADQASGGGPRLLLDL